MIATKTNNLDTVGYGCSTAPYQAVVEDNSTDPVIAYTTETNQSCDTTGQIVNGAITFTVTPGTGTSNLFDYTWNTFPHFSPGVRAAATANQKFDNIGYGGYEVRVEDTGSGCFSTATISIADNPLIPVVEDADVVIVDQILCTADGSITVAELTLGGAPDPALRLW